MMVGLISCFILFGSTLLVNVAEIGGKTVHADDGEADKRIVTYYTNWANYGRSFHVLDLDVQHITHILYAFGDFCWEGEDNRGSPPGRNACFDMKTKENTPNGTVVSSDAWADFDNVGLVRLTPEEEDTWELDYYGNLGAFHKLKQENPHVKVMFSLGGWTLSKHFSDVVHDEKARVTFAETAVDFIRTYDLDGIDIDWEFPVGGGNPGNSNRPEDKQNHTLLLEALRDELDKYEAEDDKVYELSIASSANPDYLENNEMEKIGELLDFVNIMTYDFYVAEAGVNGHNAALFNDPQADVEGMALYNVKTAIEGHLDAGIPADKLVMGMPVYGRSWKDCDGEYTACSGPSKGTWEDGTVDYDHVIAKMGEAKYERHWNDIAKVPYLTSEDGEFISFDDVESVKHKAAFAKELDLGGAMFWELSQDRENDLIRATVNVFNDVSVDKDLTIDSKDAIKVEKDQKITGKTAGNSVGFEVVFPVNLPNDTKFNVYSGKERVKALPEGYVFAGGNFDFELDFPKESEHVEVTYDLSIALDADAINPVVHYYDIDTEQWVEVTSDQVGKDEMIQLEVSRFSQYAVLGEGDLAKQVSVLRIVFGTIGFMLIVAVIALLVIRRKENAEDW